MLSRVTITGADDNVDPQALIDLSREFPFVEWGILRSTKRVGTPRYPSAAWIVDLLRTARGTVQLAAHLCGDYTRGVLAGDDNSVDTAFQRHQVNGFHSGAEALVPLARRCRTEFILQVRDEAQITAAAEVARAVGTDAAGRASLLFDPSGGSGLAVSRWPAPPPDVPMGYAGGIKPETVLNVLHKIGPLEVPFWIDMESGVRDAQDRFDLTRVRAVLERVSPLVVAPPVDEQGTSRRVAGERA